MTVTRIDAVGDFCHRALLAALDAHSIPGAELTDPVAATHTRLLRLDGVITPVTVRFVHSGVIAVHEAGDPLLVADVVGRWFGLHVDTGPIDRALGRDPILTSVGPWLPGLRLIGFPDQFEAVASTILGQQVSLAAARTFLARLVATYGRPHNGLRAFPRPHVLAADDPDAIAAAIRIPRTRARTLHRAATAWADGQQLDPQAPDAARATLLALPGIGPWTADYLLVRSLGHPDTFASGDVVARRALDCDTAADAERLAHRWAPYRSYALMHLWTSAAYLGPHE